MASYSLIALSLPLSSWACFSKLVRANSAFFLAFTRLSQPIEVLLGILLSLRLGLVGTLLSSHFFFDLGHGLIHPLLDDTKSLESLAMEKERE